MSIREKVAPRAYSLPRVREEPHSASFPRVAVIVIVAAVVVSGLCLLYLWQGTAILALTAERESARAALTSIQEVNRYLEFKVDRAFSLSRVEQIAREELHMEDPKFVRYVEIPGK